MEEEAHLTMDSGGTEECSPQDLEGEGEEVVGLWVRGI